MTKVTITAPADGNEPTSQTPARANVVMADAIADQSPAFDREEWLGAVKGLVEALLNLDVLSEKKLALLDQACGVICKDHDTPVARQVWADMAKDLSRTHERFRMAYTDWKDDGAIESDNGAAGAAYRASVAASKRGAGVLAAYRAQIAVERYARFLAFEGVYASYACNPPALVELARRVTKMQAASRQYAYDHAPLLKALAVGAAFFSRRAPNNSPGGTEVATEWDAALQEAREANIALRDASTAQAAYETEFPNSGDGDPAYDELTGKWDVANARLFRALRRLVAMPAPDAAALAHQIQAHSWLTCVTDHRIDGLTSWPLDPACPKIAAAVDEAGSDDERGLLALFRSACALAGGVAVQPIRNEAEPPELLAAE